MEAWLLREWQRNSAWQLLLRPLSWLFALLAFVRRALYRAGIVPSHRAGVPVIVIGNISVGGTGKTPVVLAVVELLLRANRFPGIVTRGYMRDRDGAPQPSDEAALLIERAGVPVFAAAERIEACRALRAAHPEVDVIVADDGLQHYALRRDVEVCVVDGARGFGNGALLPAGPLRERPSRIAGVDAVVVNRTMGHVGGSAVNTAAFAAPSFAMTLAGETFVQLPTARRLDCAGALVEFAGKRIHAAAGIGHPQRFFTQLARLGLVVHSSRPWPDHHAFAPADFADVDADVILLTEKDAVKCRSFADARFWFMRVDAVLPEAFGELLLSKLSDAERRHVA